MLLYSVYVVASILLVVYLTSILKLNTFFSLLLVSLLLGLITLPASEVVSVLKEGFGHTMQKIGLIIILGTGIGVILDRSGGTISMANYILSKLGTERAPLAMGISGFLIGLPIFCDSGFIVLSGLNKTLALKSKTSMAVMGGILATSLYAVHCLIPPHPGAAAAAGILQVNLGYLMLTGIFISIVPAGVGYMWCLYIGKKYGGTEISILSDSEKPQPAEYLPSPILSFLPVVLPILLISIKSVVILLQLDPAHMIVIFFMFIGDPVCALLIGMVSSFFLIKEVSIGKLNELLADAIEKAGPIIVIIGAGGAFGQIIQHTGTGAFAAQYLGGTGLGLMIPFLIAAILKTAQGSSTVAIMTAASITLPMLTTLKLDTEWGKILTVLSMGAGSMMVSHANDAYFWVISKFSSLDPGVTLRVYSTATIVMALSTLATILILSYFVL